LLDDSHRADIAAVQHGVDVEAFKHSHRWPRELHMAVSVANDADSQIVVSETTNVRD
jgi:hypothetical protein